MTDRLAEIFLKQQEYLSSLLPIYLANGDRAHVSPMPWPLDSRNFQEEFRLLAWRCTEEVVEAIEIHLEHTDSLVEYIQKFNEEVCDAFHFLVELTIALGIGEMELVSGIEGMVKKKGESDYLYSTFQFVGNGSGETIPQRWGMFVYQLGLAMHELRQRPWRIDHRPTNRARLVARMNSAFITFICACRRSDISADDLYNAYFAKSRINKMRRDQNMPRLPKSECSIEGEEDDQDAP
jgi:hypothetical protein